MVAIAMVLTACFPEGAPAPTATPTAGATAARPRFELATYRYALQPKGKIRIGALDNTAPLSSRDPNGRYSGFEPDLGRELAKAIFGPRQDIDAVIEWVAVDPSTALTALTSLQADVVIARLPITEERDGIGAKKNASDRQGFTPFLNTWLAGVIRDGTWGRLYAQHITPLSKETRTSP